MLSKHSPFTTWEKATGVPAAAQTGLLPLKASLPLTALLFLLFAVFLYPVQGLGGVLFALLAARLIALDATTYTLPNIYTLPLLAIGLAHAATHGLLLQSFLVCLMLLCLLWLTTQLGTRMGMGAGDLKLAAALFAFLPAPQALFSLGIGSILWLPVAFFMPRRAVPFGIPILLGWLLFLRFPGLPNWFFSTIP